MPFPPTFTNNWDTTFPPDTQLANLLGADLRQVRVDVMQRMSLLSGTLANRPTPETVNASWGGTGYGLLYFSTDTSQVFQWNGSAWADISNVFNNAASLKRYSDITQYSFSSAGTFDTTGVTIPNGVLVSGSQIRITFWGNTSNAQVMRLKITTGSTFQPVSASLAAGDFFVEAEFQASAHGAQGYYNVYNNGALIQSAQTLTGPFLTPPTNPSVVFTEYFLTGGPLVTQNGLGVRVFI